MPCVGGGISRISASRNGARSGSTHAPVVRRDVGRGHEAAGFLDARRDRGADRAAVVDVGTVGGERADACGASSGWRIHVPALHVAVVVREVVEVEVLERLRGAREEPRAALREREAVLGVVQRARRDLAEAARAPLLEHREPAVDRAGHRDRMRTEHRHRRSRPTARATAAAVAPAGARPTPRYALTAPSQTIVSRSPPKPHMYGVTIAEHEVRGERGVDRVAAVGEHRGARGRGEVVRRRHDAVRVRPRFLQPHALGHRAQTLDR